MQPYYHLGNFLFASLFSELENDFGNTKMYQAFLSENQQFLPPTVDSAPDSQFDIEARSFHENWWTQTHIQIWRTPSTNLKRNEDWPTMKHTHPTTKHIRPTNKHIQPTAKHIQWITKYIDQKSKHIQQWRKIRIFMYIILSASNCWAGGVCEHWALQPGLSSSYSCVCGITHNIWNSGQGSRAVEMDEKYDIQWSSLYYFSNRERLLRHYLINFVIKNKSHGGEYLKWSRLNSYVIGMQLGFDQVWDYSLKLLCGPVLSIPRNFSCRCSTASLAACRSNVITPLDKMFCQRKMLPLYSSQHI